MAAKKNTEPKVVITDTRIALELTDDDKAWAKAEILKLLEKYHQTADQLGLKPKKQPEVSVFMFNGCPKAKYGRDTLGRIPIEHIKSRDLVEVEDALFSLPGALNLPLVFSDLPEEQGKVFKDQLWGIARALTEGLQTVFRRQFQDPTPAKKLASAAYRICNEGIENYLDEVKDPVGKLAKPLSTVVATATLDYASRFNNWEARNTRDKSPPWPKVTGFPVKGDLYSLELVTPKRYREICPTAPKELPKEIVLLTLRVQAGAQKRQRTEPIVIRVQVRGSSSWSTLKRCLNKDKGYKMTQGRVAIEDNKLVFKMGFKKPRLVPSTGKTALVVIPALNDLAVVYSHEAVYLRGKYKRAGIKLPKGIDSTGFVHDTQKFDAMVSARKGKRKPWNKVPSIPKGIEVSKFLDLKYSYDKLRSERARHLNFVGKGARGHGKKRFRLSLEVVEGREADRIKTWMEQQASHIARYAQAIGAIVGIDDMVSVPKAPDRRIERALRRFPWCTFRDKIIWACNKLGVPTKVMKHTGAKDCPMCGEKDCLRDAQMRRGQPDAWCSKCGMIAPKILLRAWRLFRVLLANDPELLAVVDEHFNEEVTKHTRTCNRTDDQDPETLGLVEPEEAAE